MPVGNDPGGNLILLAIKGAERGGVFFWNHDFECDDDDASSYYDNVTKLATGFSEFLSGLYLTEED